MFDEVEDDKGYKFYISKSDPKRKKDHPLLIKIIKAIKGQYSDVRYSTYRVVLKLKKLQKELKTSCISYRIALSIIHKHKKFETAQETIDPRQLTDIIYDIFYASEKAGLFIDHKKEFHLETAVSILTNFIWNIFDPKRTQNINMMELKMTLLILCDSEPNAYMSYFSSHYEIIKNYNQCLTKTRFEEFINIFGKILSYLGEPIYFEAKVIADILTEAFSNSPGFNGINQDDFYNLWTSHQTTKFSAYTNIFLLLIRFKKSEFVVHQNDCTGCHKFPIVGLRYKCQKCKISLCFDCFSRGFTSKRHSFGHRFYELSSSEKDQSMFCAIFAKFLSIFRPQSSAASINLEDAGSRFDLGHTKLIEDEHIELVQVDEDMDVSSFRKRRGTIRSEVYNNSENLLIQQRDLMNKFLTTIEKLKDESEKISKAPNDSKDVSIFLNEQAEIFLKIHEELSCTFNRTQNNNTIRPFNSPTKSIFIPSSTPYVAIREKAKANVNNGIMLGKSINGYDVNKTYLADNAEYSLTDLSTFFLTKASRKVPLVSNKFLNRPLDETDTYDENYKDMVKKMKELKDLFETSADPELQQTMDTFSQKFDEVVKAREN